MTNPGNIVRVRARRGGRASVYEANCLCQVFSSGILSGQGVVQNTVANMNVLVGGSPDNPEVVIAKTPTGYRVALDLVGQQPLQITKPATGSRVSLVVAYTDDLALTTDETNTTGSPNTCGLIVVNGTGTTAPTDAQIRSAITADGGTGTQAAYAILASITVASTVTAISSSNIVNNVATFSGKLANNAVGTPQLADGSVYGAKINYNYIKKWVPDYSKRAAANLVSNNKATITQTGFAEIVVSGYALSDSYTLQVFISNQEVWKTIQEANAPNGARPAHFSFILPVSNGDVITATGSSGDSLNPLKEVHFIPGKFV